MGFGGLGLAVGGFGGLGFGGWGLILEDRVLGLGLRALVSLVYFAQHEQLRSAASSLVGALDHPKP